MHQQVRATRQLHQPRIDLLAMLDIRANDEHLPISLDPETIRSARMIMPLGGDNGFYIVDAGEVFAGISDLQELEIGPHVIQLHREIFSLHLDFENLPQIANRLVPAERQERDFVPGIISRGKERKALDVVPVKVRERDNDLFLLVADGAKISAQISQSRARVNDGDAVRIGERDLQAGGIAAESLKTGIADRDGSSRTIKLKLHRIVFMKLGSWLGNIKMSITNTGGLFPYVAGLLRQACPAIRTISGNRGFPSPSHFATSSGRITKTPARFSLGEQELKRDGLQKLELQPCSRINHCCASGMSVSRLTRCLRRATRLDVVSLYWDLASIYLNRGEFHNERPRFARVGTRRRDLSKRFGSGFQYNVSLNRDVLGNLCFEASSRDSL